MPRQLSLLLICSCMMIGGNITAQTSVSYTYQSLTFRSDLPAKSVLVSNINPDKAGDESPIIGYAKWADSGTNFQCHSYLRFSNLFLPGNIVENLALITKAELILYPVAVNKSPEENDKISRFTVRRVLENWSDSLTRWNNQPVADTVYEVKCAIRKKQKEKQVTVDVTGLVMDMVRNGNNGFMISYDSSGKSPVAKWQWFASPRYEDVDRRPLLVVYFKEPYTAYGVATNTDNDIRRAEDIKQQRINASSVTPVPVNTPPANPKEQ